VRALVTIAATVAVVGALAGAAPSGTVKTPPAKLTATEKKALDLVSVTATGVDPLGLIVTATFRGNVEQALGRGNLKNALVAMILEPKRKDRASAGLVTRGAGSVGETLRHTNATRVGVLRDGRRLLFFIRGPGAIDVGRIAVKAFAAPPGSNRRRGLASVTGPVLPGAPEPIPGEQWESITRGIELDQLAIGMNARVLKDSTCQGLKYMLRWIEGLAKKAELRRANLDALAKKIDAAIDLMEKNATNPLPPAVTTIVQTIAAPAFLLGVPSLDEEFANRKALLFALRSDRTIVKRLIARNDFLLASARALADDIKRAIEDTCNTDTTGPPPNQPPVVGSIQAVFTQADRTTTYSLTDASDPDGDTLKYAWTFLPPANDPSCSNRGQLASSDQEFNWYHGDDLCDHSKEDPVRGHLGAITVVVSDAGFRCTAIFLGSNNDTGPRATCARKP
jgi:hypothetical protein